MKFGQEIFALSPVAYIAVYFKMLVRNLSHAGSALFRQQIYLEENEAIRISPKHNNSLGISICNAEVCVTNVNLFLRK